MKTSAQALGNLIPVPSQYAPEVLQAISRAESRTAIGVVADLPFSGTDVWRAYEISWLAPNGLPLVGLLEFTVPCHSPNIVESKSLKLYLGSLNSESFESISDVESRIHTDLGATLKTDELHVNIFGIRDITASTFVPQAPPGYCLDQLSLSHSEKGPRPRVPSPQILERPTPGTGIQEFMVHTNLFRSLCPVTGQPDWATVVLAYKGREVPADSLLGYLISYRDHGGFHEDCCERIFVDVLRQCEPEELAVACFFTRRGGIDISPVRHTPGYSGKLHALRTLRQ